MGMQPKLRFKGFTDDWEKRRLGDVVNKVKSYSLSRDVECNESTGYKYIHYGDIHTGIADIINKKSVLPNIKPNQYDTLSVNDLIVADASEDYQGIASPAVIQALPDENLVAGLHTIALRPQATNATFLYHLLHTGNFKHFGYRTGTGLKVFGISWPNLSKFEFNLPSQKEQDEVVDLLRLLDNLIVVNQRKVDLLKKKKTGYLQKLFPKNGQNNPELRFKGFTDAWEKRRLKSMGDFRRVSVDPQKTPNTLFTEYSMPAYDNNKTPNIVLGSTIHSNRLQIGDNVLLINKLNVRQKRVWYVKRSGNNAVSSSEFMPFTSESLKLSFLKQLLLSDKSTKFMENISSGTSNSQKRITPLDISNYLIEKPTDAREQDKIGDFFETLDNLITVNQDK